MYSLENKNLIKYIEDKHLENCLDFERLVQNEVVVTEDTRGIHYTHTIFIPYKDYLKN